MKKITAAYSLIVILATILSLGTLSAYAVNSPYAVIGEDVWLLSESGGKIFLLPKTYYAPIDRMDDNFYYVTFNGVSGKIPKSGVSIAGYDKAVKDTQKIIRVAPEYSVFTEIKLKGSLEDAGADDATAPTNEPLNYHGTFKQGETVWYYVSYGGKYGYVQNTYTDNPDMTFPDFIPETEEPKDPATETPTAETDRPDLVKVLVISGVSAAILILVIIIFLPRKNKKHKYYYS